MSSAARRRAREARPVKFTVIRSGEPPVPSSGLSGQAALRPAPASWPAVAAGMMNSFFPAHGLQLALLAGESALPAARTWPTVMTNHAQPPQALRLVCNLEYGFQPAICQIEFGPKA